MSSFLQNLVWLITNILEHNSSGHKNHVLDHPAEEGSEELVTWWKPVGVSGKWGMRMGESPWCSGAKERCTMVGHDNTLCEPHQQHIRFDKSVYQQLQHR